MEVTYTCRVALALLLVASTRSRRFPLSYSAIWMETVSAATVVGVRVFVGEGIAVGVRVAVGRAATTTTAPLEAGPGQALHISFGSAPDDRIVSAFTELRDANDELVKIRAASLSPQITND